MTEHEIQNSIRKILDQAPTCKDAVVSIRELLNHKFYENKNVRICEDEKPMLGCFEQALQVKRGLGKGFSRMKIQIIHKDDSVRFSYN